MKALLSFADWHCVQLQLVPVDEPDDLPVRMDAVSKRAGKSQWLTVRSNPGHKDLYPFL